ncbi:hypothetical protein [Thermococcus sp. GR6]|nr:hypothetical protein [Thermococcus sp. GR6]
MSEASQALQKIARGTGIVFAGAFSVCMEEDGFVLGFSSKQCR